MLVILIGKDVSNMLKLGPITLKEANNYITLNHRHHGSTRGWKFGIGLFNDNNLIGVVIVGRPVARGWDYKKVAEVTRLCTDGTKNACSMLYSAARRACLAMGYEKVITYILESESGQSLKASGWHYVRMTAGGSWNSKSRLRVDKHPTEPKQLWETE